jgi:hypothetical protein
MSGQLSGFKRPWRCAPAMHPEGVGQNRQPRVSDAPKAQAPPWESGRLPPTKNPEGVRQSASRLLVQPLQGCPWNRAPVRPRVASRALGALLTLGFGLYCPFGPKEQRSAVSKQPSLRTWNAAPWIVTSEHLRMLRGCLAASRGGTGLQPSLRDSSVWV